MILIHFWFGFACGWFGSFAEHKRWVHRPIGLISSLYFVTVVEAIANPKLKHPRILFGVMLLLASNRVELERRDRGRLSQFDQTLVSQVAATMKRPDPMTIAAGLAIAAGLTAGLNEDQLLFLFLACVVGLGAIYVSEIFRLTK